MQFYLRSINLYLNGLECDASKMHMMNKHYNWLPNFFIFLCKYSFVEVVIKINFYVIWRWITVFAKCSITYLPTWNRLLKNIYDVLRNGIKLNAHLSSDISSGIKLNCLEKPASDHACGMSNNNMLSQLFKL